MFRVMKVNQLRKLLCLITLALLVQGAFAQDKTEAEKTEEKANSLESFLSRENLTRLISTTISNSSISDGKGNLKFATSLFNIKAAVYSWGDSARKEYYRVDTIFMRRGNKKLRSIEVGFTSTIDEEGMGIETFNPSLKIALFNKRDLTLEDRLRILNLDGKQALLDQQIIQMIINDHPELAKKWKLNISGPGGITYPDNLEDSTQIKSSIKRVLANNDFSIKEYKILKEGYSNFVTSKKRMALLTWDVLIRMGNEEVNGYSSELKLTQGLNIYKPKNNPWDFEISAMFNVKNQASTDVITRHGRKEFVFALNSNHVLIEKDDESTLEFKGGADFTNILEGLMAEEKRNTFNFNAVLTKRLSKNLYLPISLKYDIENHNFLGFLSFSWNIGNKQ